MKASHGDTPQKPKPSRKGIGGRPTLYKPEYCQRVIELGKTGLSLHQISARLDVAIDTLSDWRKKYPEFSRAISRARELSQAWWEDAGAKGMHSREFNAKVWEISVRNRFPESYREKTEHTITTIPGCPEDILSKARKIALDQELQKRS